MLLLVLLSALLAPVIAKHGPTEQPYRSEALTGPTVEHWLGVEDRKSVV